MSEVHTTQPHALDPECLFCRIISGQEDASIVYRDERVTAFLDVAPVNPGHTLVVPNEHAAWVSDLEPDTGAYVFRVGMQVAQALRRSELRCEGINIWLADGEAAFQAIPHAHLHVFPRIKGDGFAITRRNWKRARRDDLERAATALRAALDRLEAGAPPASVPPSGAGPASARPSSAQSPSD